MTRVYGSATVEPEGMELDDDSYTDACPECGKPATFRYWQSAEGGSINPYESVSCSHCGHFETDWSEP